MDFVKNGAALIQSRIDSSEKTVTVSGNYEIEKTILIPSDFHLVLDNCYLKMADDTFCNMFTNANCRVSSETDRNIVIEGRGNVVLDGGTYNGLSERNHSRDGRPHISVNSMILFAKVDGFQVKNLHIRNQRWWATNFLFCKNGHIADLDFCADASYVDEEGQVKIGLDLSRYEATRVKNADGIDIRRGCQNILIENITGFTEDDTVAITSLPGNMETEMFCLSGASSDISGIVVRNVMSSAFCSNVRLLCQGGGKLYNILIDNVMDTSKDSPYMIRGGHGVKVGDQRLYHQQKPKPEEIYNITVRNVRSRSRVGVGVYGPIGYCLVDNVAGFDGCGKTTNFIDCEDSVKYLP